MVALVAVATVVEVGEVGEDAAVVVVAEVEVEVRAKVKIAGSVNTLPCPLAASDKTVASPTHLARITLNLFLDSLTLTEVASRARTMGCLKGSNNNPTWEHKDSSSQVSKISNSQELVAKGVSQKERVDMATIATSSSVVNANLIIQHRWAAQPSHNSQVTTIKPMVNSSNTGSKTSSRTAWELLSRDLMELATDLQQAFATRSNASSITFSVPKKSHSDYKLTKA